MNWTNKWSREETIEQALADLMDHVFNYKATNDLMIAARAPTIEETKKKT